MNDRMSHAKPSIKQPQHSIAKWITALKLRVVGERTKKKNKRGGKKKERKKSSSRMDSMDDRLELC